MLKENRIILSISKSYYEEKVYTIKKIETLPYLVGICSIEYEENGVKKTVDIIGPCVKLYNNQPYLCLDGKAYDLRALLGKVNLINLSFKYTGTGTYTSFYFEFNFFMSKSLRELFGTDCSNFKISKIFIENSSGTYEISQNNFYFTYYDYSGMKRSTCSFLPIGDNFLRIGIRVENIILHGGDTIIVSISAFKGKTATSSLSTTNNITNNVIFIEKTSESEIPYPKYVKILIDLFSGDLLICNSSETFSIVDLFPKKTKSCDAIIVVENPNSIDLRNYWVKVILPDKFLMRNISVYSDPSMTNKLPICYEQPDGKCDKSYSKILWIRVPTIPSYGEVNLCLVSGDPVGIVRVYNPLPFNVNNFEVTFKIPDNLVGIPIEIFDSNGNKVNFCYVSPRGECVEEPINNTIWVKVPFIPHNNYAYLYIKRSDNLGSTDGSNVFTFYDDFTRLNESKWFINRFSNDKENECIINDGILWLVKNSIKKGCNIRTKNFFINPLTDNYIIEFKFVINYECGLLDFGSGLAFVLGGTSDVVPSSITTCNKNFGTTIQGISFVIYNSDVDGSSENGIALTQSLGSCTLSEDKHKKDYYSISPKLDDLSMGIIRISLLNGKIEADYYDLNPSNSYLITLLTTTLTGMAFGNYLMIGSSSYFSFCKSGKGAGHGIDWIIIRKHYHEFLDPFPANFQFNNLEENNNAGYYGYVSNFNRGYTGYIEPYVYILS